MVEPLILHIDDDGFYRELFRRLAAGAFQDVQGVDSLEAAKAIIETGKPVVCFLDLNLQETQGQATLQEFSRRFPGLPVIVLSGQETDLPANQTAFRKGDEMSAIEFLQEAQASIHKAVEENAVPGLDKLGELSGILKEAAQERKEDHA